MLKRVNAERAKHGVAPLTLDSTLVEMSRIRAEELSRYYNSNHKRPDGREWYTILDTLKGTGLENGMMPVKILLTAKVLQRLWMTGLLLQAIIKTCSSPHILM